MENITLLKKLYGEDKVTWAENYRKEHEYDYQDELDRNYP